MKKESIESGAEVGLRMYEFVEDGVSGWMVSGTGKTLGKRWRRRFPSKEKAEQFMVRELRRLKAEQGGEYLAVGEGAAKVEACGNSDRKRSGDSSLLEGQNGERGKPQTPAARLEKRRGVRGRRAKWSTWKGAAVIILVAVAFGIDVRVREREIDGVEERVMSFDFEANPVMAGWRGTGSDVAWIGVEGASDQRAIAIRKGEWVSPVVGVEPQQWYRLAFRCKTSGLSGADGPARCRVKMINKAGETIGSNLEMSVRPSEAWRKVEIRFRARSALIHDGLTSPSAVRVEFQSDGALAMTVDEVVLEKTSVAEVDAWADEVYTKLPAKLQYRGKESRWRRLPVTMEKLRSHQKIRVVFVGEGVEENLGNAPVDVYLQRLYPGCAVEVVSLMSWRREEGVLEEDLKDSLVKLRADLVVVGGLGEWDRVTRFQAVVDAVRASNAVTKRRTEVLLTTCGWEWMPFAYGPGRLTSDLRELDQEPDRNPVVPQDYRGRLMKFAAENGVEFLDVMGIVSEFLFGPAAVAHAGLRTGSDGVPLSYWMRDWSFPEESSKHIMGRILETYFAASDVGTVVSRLAKEGGQLSPVRVFDPEGNLRDRETYAIVKREFGASAVERPILALRFAGGSSWDDWRGASVGTGFRVAGDVVREIGYNFDEPLDVRDGDIVVYWAFRSSNDEGEEKGKLAMRIGFSEPTVGGREERSQVSLTVRPGAAATLGVGGGRVENEVEHLVEVPVENFVDRQRVAKFRLLLRWAGGDRVVVEAASWNSRARRWEEFVPFDRPGAAPLVMDLNCKRELLGTTTFKSIYFEAQSAVPVLESVLVAMRPSMIR